MTEEPDSPPKILNRTVAPASVMLFALGGLAASAAIAELAVPLLVVCGCLAGYAYLNRKPPPSGR